MFTTTITKSGRKSNEYPFPAFTGDFFNKDNEINLNRSVGFCGAITHQIRYEVLSILSNSDKIKTDSTFLPQASCQRNLTVSLSSDSKVRTH